LSAARTFHWQWCALNELSAGQLYAVLAAREAVFIVEQRCAYQDLDGWDLKAEHLVAWSGVDVAGYLRLLAPGVRFAEPSIGRILTMQAFRGSGLGRQVVAKGIEHAQLRYPGCGVRISAQSHLEKFYQSLRFETVSAGYLEDGIPHVEMLLAPSRA
jgi:ElaA protein